MDYASSRLTWCVGLWFACGCLAAMQVSRPVGADMGIRRNLKIRFVDTGFLKTFVLNCSGFLVSTLNQGTDMLTCADNPGVLHKINDRKSSISASPQRNFETLEGYCNSRKKTKLTGYGSWALDLLIYFAAGCGLWNMAQFQILCFCRTRASVGDANVSLDLQPT